MASVSVVVLNIGVGVTGVANLAAQTSLPFELVIDPIHGNANSHTYTVQVVWMD